MKGIDMKIRLLTVSIMLIVFIPYVCFSETTEIVS
jgi:competence protein ComGC